MKVIKTYKYKLAPNSTQNEAFNQWIGTCRCVYNLALETRIYAWRTYGISLSMYDIKKQLPELKKEFEWIKKVHSQTLQEVIIRMDKAYQNFFRGNGFPKWAKKDVYNSFSFTQGVSVNNNYISLPKIGKVKFRNSRPIVGEIKQTIIKKESSGYFVCITVETHKSPFPKKHKTIGIDMGVAHLMTTSDGRHIQPSVRYKDYKDELRILQRRLARQRKFGSNWKKTKHQLNKLHSKVSNVRKDHLHKTSTQLINENQVIVIEDLKVKNMSSTAKGNIEAPGRNVKAKSGLNRSVLNSGMGMLGAMLEYKADWYGRELIKVDPKYTSQQCSSCGHKAKDNRKSQAVFECISCGHKENADVNAAKNILARAMASGSKRKAVA